MAALLRPSQIHWQRLAKREQRALQGLAVFTLLTTFYLLLWQPQQQALRDAEQGFIEATHLHQQLQQLPAASAFNPLPAISADALPGLLARSTSQAGLNLERMDHEAPGRISVALEGPLGSLIGWVDQLEQKQVDVLSFSIEVNKDALATARLQVQTR
nr:type II secretion system protein GspM [Pseudomonas sp. Fl4BN1]